MIISLDVSIRVGDFLRFVPISSLLVYKIMLGSLCRSDFPMVCIIYVGMRIGFTRHENRVSPDTTFPAGIMIHSSIHLNLPEKRQLILYD